MKGRKGFTLFTALVSTTLILLTVLVVQNMIKTESGINSTISNMQAQTKATTNLDILKSDALQTFNLVLRENIERFYAYRTSLTLANDYDTLPGEHVQRFYGVGGVGTGAPMAQYIAEIETSFIRKMQQRGASGGFEEFSLSIPSILLPSGAEDPNKVYFTQEKLRDVLEKSFTSIDPSTGKLKFFSTTNMIGCESPNKCPVGSYYLLIDFADPAAVTDQEFLQMPNIRITSLATERVSEQGMLPRAMFKAYVPLRYFQAVWRAKDLYDHVPPGPYPSEDTAKAAVCAAASASNRFKNGYNDGPQLKLDPNATACAGTNNMKGIRNVSINAPGYIEDIEVSFIEEDSTFIVDGSLEAHKFTIGVI